ncbi:MAG TPA: 50S ribosomal protein L30 [Gaiella sp.]
MTTVRITQTRSSIGQTQKHRGTLRSLGLGRIGKTAEHALGPELEGKLRHVAHLVSVEQTAAKGKDD